MALHLEGLPLQKIVVREPRLRWPLKLPSDLAGQQLLKIARRAKYLLFQFELGTLIVHLGMSGRLRVLPSTHTYDKHDHVDFFFGNGKLLRYHDPRRFGSIHWQPANTVHWTLQQLGPEPLSDDFDADYLFQVTRKRTLSIKSLLMNARVVVGVGNIYANEALFLARIRPQRKSARVTRAECTRLVDAIKDTLEAALQAGGTTLRDYFGVEGESGYFKVALQVYGRRGEPCTICAHPLKSAKNSTRQTIYCPNCQS